MYFVTTSHLFIPGHMHCLDRSFLKVIYCRQNCIIRSGRLHFPQNILYLYQITGLFCQNPLVHCCCIQSPQYGGDFSPKQNNFAKSNQTMILYSKIRTAFSTKVGLKFIKLTSETFSRTATGSVCVCNLHIFRGNQTLWYFLY